MSSSTIDIQLNIRGTSFSKDLTPNVLNFELYNRHSANIQCLARQPTFTLTFELAMCPKPNVGEY